MTGLLERVSAISAGFLFLVLLCAAAATPFGVAAVTPTRMIFHMYQGTLLSGNTTSCQNATATTCIGGLAGQAGYARYLRATLGVPVVFMPNAERTSTFVQMHPLTWGVSGPVFDYFGIKSYSGSIYLPEELRPGMSGLYKAAAKFAVGNLALPASHRWNQVTAPYHYDATANLAIIAMGEERAASASPVVAAVRNRVISVREIYNDSSIITLATTNGASTYPELLRLLETDPGAPSILAIEESNDTPLAATFGAPRRINATWVVMLAAHTATGEFVITTDGNGNVTNVTYSLLDITKLATSRYRDSNWAADQQFMQSLADEASRNDPVLAYSTTAMPQHRTGTFRLCMGGECAAGNLFCDGMRTMAKADFAMTNSGGYRGNGWSAGPLLVSALWTLLPFANLVCVGNVLGLKLLDMLNSSVSFATWNTTFTATGNQLWQVSGLKYVVDASRPPGQRLISVSIFDRATNTWGPVNRLKLYSYATESFMCQSFAPYSTLLAQPTFPGEALYKFTPNLMQDQIGVYLSTRQNYSHALDGRITNIEGWANKSLYASMTWVQKASDCVDLAMYYDSILQSCLPCAVGTRRVSNAPNVACTLIPLAADYTVIYAIAIPISSIAVITAVVVITVIEMKRRGNTRNVSYAPKGGIMTLMFTDIEKSTSLWSTVPSSMSAAMDVHHAVIRAAIARHKAYEVKSIGDAFMIACETPEQAVALSVDIQRSLVGAAWPSAINRVYDLILRLKVDLNDVDIRDIAEKMDPPADADTHAWNGLRVRIGIHTGPPSVTFDEVAKGYDYYGPVVNAAARIESSAEGGQVCVSAETFLAIDPSNSMRKIMTSAGFYSLRGVPRPLELFNVPTVNGRQYAIKSVAAEATTAVEMDRSELSTPTDRLAESSGEGSATRSQSDDDADGLADKLETIPQIASGALDLREAMEKVATLSKGMKSLFSVVKTRTKKDDAMKAAFEAWKVAAPSDSSSPRGGHDSYVHLSLRVFMVMIREEAMERKRSGGFPT